MSQIFKYNINLPKDIESILDEDFCVIDSVNAGMLRTLTEPVKFGANTWIFINKGVCKGDISLISHDIVGPAVVTINRSQILQPQYISEDFEATVIVMSKRFHENLFVFLANTTLCTMISRHVTVPIPGELMPKVEEFMETLRSILSDHINPYCAQALVFEFAGFLFRTLYKCYEPFTHEIATNHGRMADQFLALVQENYKTERFLDFYARKLEVTPKHLSRTLKNQTGFTAVEWIERFVILEAKVLLKSTNLNIQQVADELNFPSQSFFGKYFKKYTGMSPKEFRNS